MWKHIPPCQVKIADLAREPFLILVAGSVCKDFSSMGKGDGFMGQYVTLCAIFIALCRKTSPTLVVHECTPRFPFKVFKELLPRYVDHHSILNAHQFGVPVQRNRAWDAIVRKDWVLEQGLHGLHEFSSKCTLDSSFWLQAPSTEAARRLGAELDERCFYVILRILCFPTPNWLWTVKKNSYIKNKNYII